MKSSFHSKHVEKLTFSDSSLSRFYDFKSSFQLKLQLIECHVTWVELQPFLKAFHGVFHNQLLWTLSYITRNMVALLLLIAKLEWNNIDSKTSFNTLEYDVNLVGKSRYVPIMWTWWNVHVTSFDERSNYENYFKVGRFVREAPEGILTWTSIDHWQNDTRIMWRVTFVSTDKPWSWTSREQSFISKNVWTHRSQRFGIEGRRTKFHRVAERFFSSSQSSKCFLLTLRGD